ncbi:MAG TPA: alpha/beta hydrolase [Baekduia sp.]|nr:alpha/beta hydrolase [Baekduia sp.]
MTGELGLTRAGSGAPLVLLHALGAHRGIWDPVLPFLTAERDVLAFDLPGFGDSAPYPDGEAHPRRMATTVTEECKRLGLETPAVAGSSFGGWVALEMALVGAASSVTAIAPAGLWRGPLVPRPLIGQVFARALYPVIPLAVWSRRVRHALLMSQMVHPERVPRRDALLLLRRYARARGLANAQRAMRANSFTELDDIQVPVTLVWPDHDRLVRRPRRLPEQIDNLTLPDAGHLPQWDAPAAVAAALLAGSAAARVSGANPTG